MSDPGLSLTTPGSATTPTGPAGTTPPATAAPSAPGRPRGLLGDAWYDLRRNPIFWTSSAFILLFIVMAVAPSLFTSVDPNYGTLDHNRETPSANAWFGYDVQGQDVYARVVYGARASIVVGVLAALGTTLLGGVIGILAGFRGGWVDAVVSRFADVFFGLPFVLGAIVILFTFNTPGSQRSAASIMALVVLALVVLTWPLSMRIMRSSVLATKNADYIVAARALGASNSRIIFRHLLPNCLAPLLVYATLLVGTFIGAEATLSYLGIGLRSPVVSWGVMISDAQDYLRVSPHMLLFPAAILVLTVLSFVMLGEAVREALDPKMR